jgi:hypothetical protein
MSAHLPVTAPEIAVSALGAAEAGAAIVLGTMNFCLFPIRLRIGDAELDRRTL